MPIPEMQEPLPNPGRSDAERWVWDRVLAGEMADLGEFCALKKGLDKPEHLDPRQGDDLRWRDDCRRIGAGFIARVLTHEPWRDALPHQGLRIAGARVDDALDLTAARIGTEVCLTGSRFESRVVLIQARVEGLLSLDGTVFERGIDAGRLRVDGDLFLREGALVRGGPLSLQRAEVKGLLFMDGATFEGGILAYGLQVGGDLFLRKGARVQGGLEMPYAEVKGLLNMEGAAVEGGVRAHGLRLGGDLFLRGGARIQGGLKLQDARIGGNLYMGGSAFEGDVEADGMSAGGLYLNGGTVVCGLLRLLGVKLGGNLYMGGSTFEGGVEAERLHVGGHLLLLDARFKVTPVIQFARVEGGLNLQGTTLPGLDLASSVIVGDLQLAAGTAARGPKPVWSQDARLILRNTRVGALQDRHDAWPPGEKSLDLHGFVYDRLGGAYGGGEDAMLVRPTDEYARWLARDPTFARQPYQQLAAVFRAAGYPDKAEAVLYAARDRELAEAWKTGRYLEAAGLALLKISISYGLTSWFFFQVLFWVLVLTMVGAAVLSFPPAAQAHGPGWRLFASLDQLLPIVELNKEFGDFFNDPGRRRLAAWQLAYFSVHSLLGFLLGSFVVAALGGLTQGRR